MMLAAAMLGMKFVSTHATMLAEMINHVSERMPLPRTTPMVFIGSSGGSSSGVVV